MEIQKTIQSHFKLFCVMGQLLYGTEQPLIWFQIRVQELEKMLDTEQQCHEEERATLEEELQQLREEIANKLEEYHDLMDIKVSLDWEIATYRKLIESGEADENTLPIQSADAYVMQESAAKQKPARAKKKKCTRLEEREKSHVKGELEISEICVDGKFVRLHNKGNKVS
jgi:hypothetical protein